MQSSMKMGRQVLGVAMGAVLAVAGVGCGPQTEEELSGVEGGAQTEAAQAAPVDVAQTQAALDDEDPGIPPECPECPPPEESDWPYYTLFWKAKLRAITCADPSDNDGMDEIFLWSEVTGDNAAESFWGPTNMTQNQTIYFNTNDSYPTALYFQTYSVGASGKQVAIWDYSTGLFDLEQQIGVVFLKGQKGVWWQTVTGADGSYTLEYEVESTGCSPRTQPCPTGL